MQVGHFVDQCYPLKDVKKIVDIGGGQVVLIEQLLTTNPHLTGTLFDLVFSAFLMNE